MPTPFAIVMTTCGGKPEAELIATRLVEERLSACVQIFPIESVYRWEGAVQHANEWMLFCKIKSNDYANVEAAIRAALRLANILSKALHTPPKHVVSKKPTTKGARSPR